MKMLLTPFAWVFRMIMKQPPIIKIIILTSFALVIAVLCFHPSASEHNKVKSASRSVDKCDTLFDEMQVAKYAYLHGGGTKVEYQNATVRWWNCLVTK